MKRLSLFVGILVFAALAAASQAGNYRKGDPKIIVMAGEPGADSIILQARAKAEAMRFIVSEDMDTAGPMVSDWLEPGRSSDYIVKHRFTGLSPDTRYQYRAETKDGGISVEGSFLTLPGKDLSAPVTFAVVTGMNYYRFHNGPKAYTGDDKVAGYPGLRSIKEMLPDFVVFTGDNAYYDHGLRAFTKWHMRRKWHKQFKLLTMESLLTKVPAFWMKDDHDFRYDDADRTGLVPPLPDTGIEVFREQVPVVPPEDPDAPTYRTVRASRELQLWFLEGRDYRSPNRMPDGPHKTIWGTEQKKWLKRTLLESDAPVKIIVSPTPMIGPDDKRKTDNHTNIGGFRHERDGFFEWAKKTGADRGLYLVCGDRHWQYHTIHPAGFEEFSTGALVDANSRLGVKPGDPGSTDPEGKLEQPYISPVASGGFLLVTVKPGDDGPVAEFDFRDENGTRNYCVTRTETGEGPPCKEVVTE